jgi:hypothetical protein
MHCSTRSISARRARFRSSFAAARDFGAGVGLTVRAVVRAAPRLHRLARSRATSPAGQPFAIVHVERHGVVVGVARSGCAHEHRIDRLAKLRDLRGVSVCTARMD